ncbi:MAG: hypothetical protein U0163_15240 [Gemmatimonadaceae bacterium]
MSMAPAPIQYRAIIEIVGLGEERTKLSSLPLSHVPALRIAFSQRANGLWSDSILSVPEGKSESADGMGTIAAFRRLIEFGWDQDSPPIHQARRTLFRLLAEDNDPNFLFELRTKGRMEVEQVRRGRLLLREAAAAALARAGFEADPRLRGAARRILDRIAAYVRSPLAQKPWVRVGNRQVLSPEATPPSLYALEMLAFMPVFCHENRTQVEYLYSFVSQALPRQESAQLIGEEVLEQPQFVLGDWFPNRNAVDADVPLALHWLELMARLRFLARNESWMRLFTRFLDDRDRSGVWHPHKGTGAPKSASPFVWHAFPLSERDDERSVDVTFRLGLIARLIGRPIEFE